MDTAHVDTNTHPQSERHGHDHGYAHAYADIHLYAHFHADDCTHCDVDLPAHGDEYAGDPDPCANRHLYTRSADLDPDMDAVAHQRTTNCHGDLYNDANSKTCRTAH